jgi:eukaryotic-like serine/threonine-protein kinase
MTHESPEEGVPDAPSARFLSVEWLPPGTRVDRWEVVERLGAGGYGTTYSVRRAGRARGRLYALKLSLRPGERWFSREAALLARVRHRSVVRLVSHGVWRLGPVEHPFLVMEYVAGESLYAWALNRNPTARQVTGLLVQVLGALAAAHRGGALHRDFKGDNVLVTADDRVKVLDWGAGWYEGAPSLTATARPPPGSPRYYSPQLLLWRVWTERRPGAGSPYTYSVADELYAVGVTFYRLMADQYPASQWRVPQEPSALHGLQSLRDLNPHVPEGLSDVVMRLLSFAPERRPEGAAPLSDALRGVLKGAGAEWDVPLFDWREKTASGSRTTVEAEEARGPVMPGHEVALREARARHMDAVLRLREVRELRRRDPAKVAAAEARSLRALHERVGRWRSTPWSWGMIAVLFLGTLLAVALWGGRRGGAPEQVAVPAARTVQQMALPAVPDDARVPWVGASPPVPHLEKEPMPPHSPQAAQTLNSNRGAESLKRCAMAVGAAAIAACAGAQVRPDASRCPEDALAVMRELPIYEGGVISIYTDVEQSVGASSKPIIVRDGPIVSLTNGANSDLPVGTRLYGRLWTQGGRVTGRYTRAELPDHRIVPVCLVYGSLQGGQWGKGSKPGAVLMPRVWAAIVVHSFP